MRKLLGFGIFLMLYFVRYYTLSSPLPKTWTPESKVRYTAMILQKPEYTDSQTIIRSGMWYLKLKGYAVIIPGSRVSFVGEVVPKVLGSKTIQIVMKDPTFEVVGHTGCEGLPHTGCVMIALWKLREKWVLILEKSLPEPMSSLAAGILLGVKGQMPREFYDQLVNTGTLHIVAASGFNVMIVASVLMRIASKVWRRGIAILIGTLGIFGYVLVAGASASVVRAGIMGSLTLIAYYLGRPSEAKRLLWVSGGLMLLSNPLYIFDIGFQLSFMATAGLLYIEPLIPKLQRTEPCNYGGAKFLSEYLYPTLMASVATMPIIWYHFGRVSWVSPLVNMLVLPIVPLIMLLSAWTLVIPPVSYLLYVPLWWIVWVIRLFG